MWLSASEAGGVHCTGGLHCTGVAHCTYLTAKLLVGGGGQEAENKLPPVNGRTVIRHLIFLNLKKNPGINIFLVFRDGAWIGCQLYLNMVLKIQYECELMTIIEESTVMCLYARSNH